MSVAYAQHLRRNPTEVEKRLWNRLRQSQPGVRFRRQAPIGRYVVDFLNHDARLIIELDSGQHSDTADAARTRWLEGRGFRIVRFWNNQILEEMDGVLEAIRAAIASPPTLPSPARGEGFYGMHWGRGATRAP